MSEPTAAPTTDERFDRVQMYRASDAILETAAILNEGRGKALREAAWLLKSAADALDKVQRAADQKKRFNFLHGVVAELRKTMQCNCDLDNWEPEQSTGHSHVCRIHKAAMARSMP